MITLQLPNKSHQHDYESMIKEFIDNKEGITPMQMEPKEKDLSPDKGKNPEKEKFDEFLKRIENERKRRNIKTGRVSATLYFIIDENNKVVGGISIRHTLNEQLRFNGGHIGYGVRPSERKKGYASIALKLALEKCRAQGIEKAMITCDKDNIGSAKVIQKNGGVRDSEYEHEGTTKERYRITL